MDSQDKFYVPTFIPVTENEYTFMGRLLKNITDSLSKGIYLDSMSSWYNSEGNQIFGLRFIHFLHQHLGTTFLQGLDKLIVYALMSEVKKFQKDYGFIIGGGAVSEEHRKMANRHNPELNQFL